MTDIELGQAVGRVIQGLQERCAVIGSLVSNLRAVFPNAEPPAIDVHEIPAERPRPLLPGRKPASKRGRAMKAQKRTDGRTDGRSKVRATRAARSLPDVTNPEGLDVRIKAQLRLGPCRLADLASALRTDVDIVRRRLLAFQREGIADVQGKARAARWSLTETKATVRETASRPGDAKTPLDGTNPTAMRDAAILARLGKGLATFGELVAVMPIEPGQDRDQRTKACQNALARLRLKGQIAAGEHGWALA